jgi:integrase
MEYVEPIRDVKRLDSMKKVLRNQSKRDYLLFVMGINTGLRISDLLKMKISDVIDSDGNIKRLKLKETKTGKSRSIPYADNVKKAIKEYLKEYNPLPHDYLFKSRKGFNSPIDRKTAWRILKEAAETVGITEAIGTHSLRKTFGYHAYKSGTDITLLQEILNHSAPSITLRYIGITQHDMDNVILNLNL